MNLIFDGHNDCVQRLQEYRPDGIDFLARSTDGHLDLPRALDGGLAGGLFAMMAHPEHPPVDDLTVTKTGYEVRLAEPLDAGYARRKIAEQLIALERLVARAEGKIRIAIGVNEIIASTRNGSLAVVLHMEGAEAIDSDFIGAGGTLPLRTALARACLESPQYFWPRGAVCVGPVARYRSGADPSWKRPSQGM
jgi:membrane dipeptidase